MGKQRWQTMTICKIQPVQVHIIANNDRSVTSVVKPLQIRFGGIWSCLIPATTILWRARCEGIWNIRSMAKPSLASVGWSEITMKARGAKKYHNTWASLVVIHPRENATSLGAIAYAFRISPFDINHINREGGRDLQEVLLRWPYVTATVRVIILTWH